MGYLKSLLVIQILACVDFIAPNTLKFRIRLDSNCTTKTDDGLLAPGIAVDAANQLLAYMTWDTKLDRCCCEEKNVTCYMEYTGSLSVSTLQTYISSLGTTDCYGGSYIANMTAETFVGEKDECQGDINFTVGGRNLTGSHCYGNETDITINIGPTNPGSGIIVGWYFVCDSCSTGFSPKCCRVGETVTCFMAYRRFRSPQWLCLLTDCQNSTNEHIGAEIINVSVVQAGSTETCQGQDMDIPLRDHVVKNSSCSGNASIDLSTLTYVGLNLTGPKTDAPVGAMGTSTSDKSKTIGGAVGGTLGALSAIGPLAYYMYRKLKRNSKVGDTNNTKDLTAVPPSADFEEAPNSVPPAGTG